MHKHRIIVAGGRDFDDFWLLHDTLDALTVNMDKADIEIVSGCANGADSLGELWANEFSIEVVRFQAMWQQYGNGAGPMRNLQMAEYGTHLVAFWDGESRGTKNMIDLAEQHNLEVRVIRYE